MLNDLIENIEKIHTTPLGIERINKNLELETKDIIKWCKNKKKKTKDIIKWKKKKKKNAENIVKKGKNWYVYNGNCIITINANSYTIITAHRIRK
jgi:hypothetical protein